MKTRLTSIIDAAADKYPHQIACQFDSTIITYEELKSSAELLSKVIKFKIGKGGNRRIALLLEVGIKQITAIWGVLYAGGTYIPINVEYPEERINYILSDSNPDLIIVSNQTVKTLPERFRNRIWCIDNLCDEAFISSEIESYNSSDVSDIAYVIYTSGTTGAPKGVMVRHDNVYDLLESTASLFEFTSDDVWSMLHSYAFDFSVWEIFGAAYNKSKLLIIPQDVRIMFDLFWDYITEYKVSILSQTPTFFSQLIPVASQKKIEHCHLKYIVFGGEKLNYSSLQNWVNVYSLNDTKLINMYGITETTVHSTFYQIKEEDLYQNKSIIGSELPGWKVVLKDPNGINIEAHNIEGEICVYGKGVSSGYLNLESMTKEKFPRDSRGEVYYRSGDLGYRDAFGRLIYIGRKDRQIKIRGYRIEIDEIEKNILSIGNIKGVVVSPCEFSHGDIRLIAFYIPMSNNSLSLDNLKDYLAQRLPLYMLPYKYIEVEEFPLTTNGKINIQYLLNTYVRENKSFLDCSQELSIKAIITATCCETFGIDDISITSNFFDLGANSIILNILVSKLNKALSERNIEVSVSILDLYRHTSVSSLCDAIELKINDVRQ